MEDRKSKWFIKGKTCLITGATSGIGKVTAMELARKGANIVFTTRSIGKAEKVKDEIISKTQNLNIDFLECDLSSFKSIKNFVEYFNLKYSALHVLINDAGVWNAKRKLSKDGIENTFAVNYLAPFLLTTLLLDVIKQSAPARIINVSSEFHRKGKIDFDDLEFKKHYNSIQAYSQSKLALILFTKELSRRLKGTGVTVNAVHPGLVKTEIFRDLPFVLKKLVHLFALTNEEGAKTTIYLAVSGEVSNISGKYFAKEKIIKSSDESYDIGKAKKLLDVSVEYVREYIKKSEV
jgi:NAD(P)-dependent dehydrogenase (short-subunit alcohol dehydrogenase family)